MLRISLGIKFWDLSRGLRHWRPKFYTVRIECLFTSRFWYCEICVKNRWRGGWEHCFLDFCYCQWLTVGRMGQKVLFRVSWDGILCLLPLLKSKSTRRASCHSALMVLVLVKGMRRGGESNISFCYPRGSRASPQTYHMQCGVI